MSSYIRTSQHLTIVFDDGESTTVYDSNPNYQKIIEAIKDLNWSMVHDLAIPVEKIKKQMEQTASLHRVKIDAGVVYFDEQPMHNTLTKRLIQMLNEGFNIEPMCKFLVNLMDNPSYRAVNELYNFMEMSDLPITEDGHFIAYKRVKSNWMDQYSGKIDNSVGRVVKMRRNEVDENKDNTCSDGLHFCSRSYLPNYGSDNGGRIIIVKINPRDVVAIPSDYNDAKGRCCQYEVIGELTKQSEKFTTLPKEELEGSFYNTTNSGENFEDAEVSDTPILDENKTVLAKIDPNTDVVIMTYNSVIEASHKTGIDASNIRKVCDGMRNRAGGFNWKYMYTFSPYNIS